MSEIVKKFIADRFGEKEGTSVNPGNIGDVREFAQELGSFLYQLHRLPTTDAKSPSFETAFAGSDLIFFEAEMIELLKVYQKLRQSKSVVSFFLIAIPQILCFEILYLQLLYFLLHILPDYCSRKYSCFLSQYHS